MSYCRYTLPPTGSLALTSVVMKLTVKGLQHICLHSTHQLYTLISLSHPVAGVKVTKNRFDGDLGRVPLVFEKNSLTFSGLHLRQKKIEGVASGSGDHAPPALRVVSDVEGAQTSHAPFAESHTHTHTPIGATLRSVAETESSAGCIQNSHSENCTYTNPLPSLAKNVCLHCMHFIS